MVFQFADNSEMSPEDYKQVVLAAMNETGEARLWIVQAWELTDFFWMFHLMGDGILP